MELCERRQASRYDQEHKVAFGILNNEDSPQQKKIARSLTKNISSAGVMIHSDVFLPVGEMLTVELSLNGSLEVITLVGRVRWIKNVFQDELFAVGLEFVDVPPGSRMALRARLSVN
ncbi:MAG: PilZ domain-containing protein [Candidatus Aminicenantes bacterium]|nr:PilZ domain-containing protein [Candidatus Aminicenantes bacterium]